MVFALLLSGNGKGSRHGFHAHRARAVVSFPPPLSEVGLPPLVAFPLSDDSRAFCYINPILDLPHAPDLTSSVVATLGVGPEV